MKIQTSLERNGVGHKNVVKLKREFKFSYIVTKIRVGMNLDERARKFANNE